MRRPGGTPADGPERPPSVTPERPTTAAVLTSQPPPGEERRIDFRRLRRGQVVAGAAALALLLVMATDWYGSKLGDEARRVEERAQPAGALAGEIPRRLQQDARIIAESEERTSWQADAFVDRVLLAVLLLAIVAALAAAWLRAANRSSEPPFTPSAVAAGAALAGSLLLAYRMLQEPGLDAATTIKPGAMIALALLGVMAIGAASAVRADEAA